MTFLSGDGIEKLKNSGLSSDFVLDLLSHRSIVGFVKSLKSFFDLSPVLVIKIWNFIRDGEDENDMDGWLNNKDRLFLKKLFLCGGVMFSKEVHDLTPSWFSNYVFREVRNGLDNQFILVLNVNCRQTGSKLLILLHPKFLSEVLGEK